MPSEGIKPILSTLPTLPGCYIYKDLNGQILYIGKAKNLRKRINSYFLNYHKLTPRIQIMIDQIYDVETYVVNSEIESLILEASLIKKYRPKYNVLLKDDKIYAWIKITKDLYPIIYRSRDTNDKNAIYFGPFPDGDSREQVLKFLRNQFPFRTCSYIITDEDNEIRAERRKNGELVRSRLCTYYHIKKCPGPCEAKVSHGEYMENINNIKKFLQNRKNSLAKDLEIQMKKYAKEEEFEKAAQIKSQIDSLKYISQKLEIKYGDDEDNVLNLAFQKAQKGLENLIKTLQIYNWKQFSKEEKAQILTDFRIECFDISNIQGTNPVGSMVVNIGGNMHKSHYRKFKINVKETPDDFAMMEEMLTRRLKYLVPKFSKNLPEDISFNSIPDLIIIDGGKGQLKKGLEVLHDLKFELDESTGIPRFKVPGSDNKFIFICGLAKRREEIFIPYKKESYLFDEKKETLFLIQRIRDEAHRFGITYHRLRRSKNMFE